MELRFTNIYDDVFDKDNALLEIERLKDFKPTKKLVKKGFKKGYYVIYINIDTVEQLEKLTNILGNHVVFGDLACSDDDKHICIEDYRGYRE